ncbi:MAG: tetratricopeptide repeat protein [bacterium]|nr:tetratricopeptide repeat protein [bacterium]
MGDGPAEVREERVLRCPYCRRASYPTRPQPRVRCAWCGRGFNVEPLVEEPWYEQVVKDLTRVLEIKKDLHLAYHTLGMAYAETGLYDRAIEVLEQELELSPEDADTYYLLGMAYAGVTTNYGRGIECLETYLRLRPDAAEEDRVRALIGRLRGLEQNGAGG